MVAEAVEAQDAGRLSWGPDALRIGYARVPSGVLRDPDLAAGPKLLYAVIASYLWGESDVAWPAQATLAEACGRVTTETIRKWTRALEAIGLLTVERVEGGTPRYRLWVPSPTPQPTLGAQPELGGGPTYVGGTPQPTLGGRTSSEEDEVNRESDARATPVPPPVENPVENSSRLAYVLAQQPPACRTLTEAWLELKSLSGMQAAAEVEALESLRLSVGAAAWEYGMRAALEHDVGRLSYVRKAAEGYRPPPERAAPRAGGGGAVTSGLPGVGGYGKSRSGWENL